MLGMAYSKGILHMQPPGGCQLPELSRAVALGQGCTKVDQATLNGPVGLPSLLVDLGLFHHSRP